MNIVQMVEQVLSSPISILGVIALSTLFAFIGLYRKNKQAESKREEADAAKNGVGVKSFLIENIWIILIIGGLIVFCFTLQMKVNSLEARFNEAPKIAVIDFTKISVDFTKTLGATVTPESLRALDELLVKTKNLTEKLVDSGYVVIDSQYVTGAPAEAYITVDDLKSYAAN